MSSRRVVLSGDDVDILRKVAPFAEKGANARYRTALTWVYVRDGLAFATDSYRLAFAEVDCDDITIPARAVDWLPIDGVTVNVERVGKRTTVSWDDDGQRVGDAYDEPNHWLTVDSVASISRGGEVYQPGNCADEPRWVCADKNVGPVATLATQTHRPLAYLNWKFLRQTLKALNDPKVAVDAPLKPLRFFDDDLTVVVMPVRPPADLYLRESA